MVVKTTSAIDHATDLAEVFAQDRKHNMRLNLEKCVFGVQGGKFLGFMITSRGIEANSEKCKAIIQMQSPQTVKEVQRLAGRLVSLSRFIPKLAEKVGPIFTLLKKPKGFLWTDQCEEAFKSFKSFLTTPPILQRPDHNTDLLLYLALAENAISAFIVQEHQQVQTLIYFISRVLQNAERRYQMIEELALALVTAAWRLRPYFQSHRPYFQSHQVVVKTDYPIKQILRKPELAGRMIAWSVELSEFGIQYESRGPLKAQCLADFIAELTPTTAKEPQVWTLHVDGLDEKIIGVSDNEDLGWMAGIWSYLKEGVLPEDKDEARKIRMRSAKFIIIGDELFKRGISSPLLKCLTASQVAYVIREVHQGICGMHSGARSMATRVLRAGNSATHTDMMSAWPFSQWGMDILGPFPPAKGQLKFLLVAIDYFTKWIEACPLAKITTENVQKFTWKNIICRFRIPHALGADAMIPVEVGKASHRRQVFNGEQNTQELAADLDLVDELKDEARIHEEACKLRASRRYNTRVKPQSFRAGDLVWRFLGKARKYTTDGKLAPTWGSPFRVTEDLENGAYRLEELSGKPIPRTWNATHLKFYYS
uniref:Retrotransposable element Tf2 n=1 Tax=Cajanus cajan TaxID=3821 RepID=A0A151SXQ6_CAJCA|nr:Retrotransposable element Tf2 [Cajanus cajan]